MTFFAGVVTMISKLLAEILHASTDQGLCIGMRT